jgi:hypothetical protein
VSAKESRKGHALPCPLRLTPNAEKVLPFYQSLPGVGFGTALLLASNFKSVKDFVNAAQVSIETFLDLPTAVINVVHKWQIVGHRNINKKVNWPRLAKIKIDLETNAKSPGNAVSI